MNRWFTCLLATAALYFFTGLTAQEDGTGAKPAETKESYRLKVQTELMQVRAVVTDREGRIVENLKKEDFELLEDKKQQEISFFSVSKIETGRKLPETDTAQNLEDNDGAGAVRGQDKADALRSLQDRLREPPVRTTLLYVDNLHMSFSNLNWIKQALLRFINEQMTEQDVVALATSHTLGVAQQFTRDRQLLKYAVEQLQYGSLLDRSRLTPLLAARAREYDLHATRLAIEIIRQEENIPCPCSLLLSVLHAKVNQILTQAYYSRRSTLQIIENYAELMADLPGKRMIVLFSDGIPMRERDGGIDTTDFRSVVNRAAHSGVVIYSIDAGGLRIHPTIDATRRWSDMEDPQKLAFIDCIDFCRRYFPPGEERDACTVACMNAYPQECLEVPIPECYPPLPGFLDSYASEYEQEGLNSMHYLAEETGGKLYWGNNNLNESLGEAFDANRFYYVLSYYVPDRENKNGYRKLDVRVRDHPEYTVRAPKGYSLSDLKNDMENTKEQTPQQRLLAAMKAPLPVTDLGVSARANYMETASDNKQVSLTVYFEGDNFRYRKEDQRSAVELEILSVIYDSSGEQVDGISARVEGKLTPAGMERARSSGYRFSRRLPLKPGIYQASVGVREEGSDRIGTASTWVEVPAITDNKLEMSSLILANPLDEGFLDNEESVQVSSLEQTKIIQGVPMYEQDDFFYYVFRIHRPRSASGGSGLELIREVLQGGKPIVQGTWTAIPEEKMNVDLEGWLDLDGEVDISGFDPGVYELRVGAKTAGSDKTVQRTVSFGIL